MWLWRKSGIIIGVSLVRDFHGGDLAGVGKVPFALVAGLGFGEFFKNLFLASVIGTKEEWFKHSDLSHCGAL